MQMTTAEETITLTCPVCRTTINQTNGIRRTICPHCGNFYDNVDTGRLLGQRPRAKDTQGVLPSLDNGVCVLIS